MPRIKPPLAAFRHSARSSARLAEKQPQQNSTQLSCAEVSDSAHDLTSGLVALNFLPSTSDSTKSPRHDNTAAHSEATHSDIDGLFGLIPEEVSFGTLGHAESKLCIGSALVLH